MGDRRSYCDGDKGVGCKIQTFCLVVLSNTSTNAQFLEGEGRGERIYMNTSGNRYVMGTLVSTFLCCASSIAVFLLCNQRGHRLEWYSSNTKVPPAERLVAWQKHQVRNGAPRPRNVT